MNLITILAIVLSLATGVKKTAPTDQSIAPTTAETVFDFGHVGIDYTIYHRFPFVNRTQDTIRITGVHVPCDCTEVFATDTIVPPGDSITLNLKFNTKDFYGPQNKSFRLDTDNPQLSHIEYFYLSIIGQWFDGITPDPLALFFLPPHKEKSIAIPNRAFDRIMVGKISMQDDYFTVEPVTPEAARGDSLKLVVRPRPDLHAGTFHSNFTVAIEKGEGEGEAEILTIPVKIVRY